MFLYLKEIMTIINIVIISINNLFILVNIIKDDNPPISDDIIILL